MDLTGQLSVNRLGVGATEMGNDYLQSYVNFHSRASSAESDNSGCRLAIFERAAAPADRGSCFDQSTSIAARSLSISETISLSLAPSTGPNLADNSSHSRRG